MFLFIRRWCCKSCTYSRIPFCNKWWCVLRTVDRCDRVPSMCRCLCSWGKVEYRFHPALHVRHVCRAYVPNAALLCQISTLIFTLVYSFEENGTVYTRRKKWNIHIRICINIYGSSKRIPVPGSACSCLRPYLLLKYLRGLKGIIPYSRISPIGCLLVRVWRG
jgi:hypothetical protein